MKCLDKKANNSVDCFAEINQDKCYALTKKKCKNCAFYKNKEKAKREYIKHRERASSCNLDKAIDTYFMNL